MCLSYFKVMKPKLKNMVSWDYANLKACDTERCFVGDTENAVGTKSLLNFKRELNTTSFTHVSVTKRRA